MGDRAGSFAHTVPGAASTRSRPVQRISSSRFPHSVRTPRRFGRAFGDSSLDLARLYILVPILVMLLAVGLIYIAIAHTLVGAFHADCAHVNVVERSRQNEAAEGRMNGVCDNHDKSGLIEIRKVHDQAGDADDARHHDHASPEPTFLTGIHLAAWNILPGEPSTRDRKSTRL